uniref:BTB domain-containing protein n=1 Tax=Glossina austeni TaxID=7395 RepID=A0A1A9UKT5_GLOAU
MGQVIIKLKRSLDLCSDSVVNILNNRRKRKATAVANNSHEEQDSYGSKTPKIRKLLSTTQYIYQELYNEQKNSDVAIMALNKVWYLHKVYLSQSPYFSSMFNGSWQESSQDFVHIKILDENITLEALDAVFGSLYLGEIEIDDKSVISIIAAATLFILDNIINKCTEVMADTINADTVMPYYDAACQYNCPTIIKSTFKWLEINLLSIYAKYRNILKYINIDLMTALISSPDLYVIECEFSLYTMLRAWVYLHLHPNCDLEGFQDQNEYQQQQAQQSSLEKAAAFAGNDHSSHAIQSFFLKRKETSSFLLTVEGQQYLKPFRALRTQYLITSYLGLKSVLNDNIIPKDWIHNHVVTHWSSILKVNNLSEEGPQNLSPDKFNENSARAGRLVLEPGCQKWCCAGIHSGLDLVLVCNSHVLKIRRHLASERKHLQNLQTESQFMIRASMTSINSQRQPMFTQKSKITSLSLEKNEKVILIKMDPQLVYPLLVSVNLLLAPPTASNV